MMKTDQQQVIFDLRSSFGDRKSFDEIYHRYLLDSFEEVIRLYGRNGAERLKSLIENGLDVNHINDSGLTPLLFAISHVNADFLSWLLRRKVDLNKRIKYGHTVISWMAANYNPRDFSWYSEDALGKLHERRYEIFKALLEHGADLLINVNDKQDVYHVIMKSKLSKDFKSLTERYYEKQKIDAVIKSKDEMAVIEF